MFVKCSSKINSEMTTFQFTLKNNAKSNGEKSIIISLIKDRKNTSLSIRQSCKEEQWSYETERVKKNYPNSEKINKFIDKYKVIISNVIDNLEDENIPYTLQDVIYEIKNHKGDVKAISYTDFQENIIENLKKSDKIGTARVERDTLNSLQNFFGKDQIGFNEIRYLSLKNYEAHCIAKGNKPATIGIRMRTIRNVFNQAIKGKVIKEKQYPFKDYKISQIKSTSKKEFLTKKEIKSLNAYEPTDQYQEFAKDMFLFSYYSRGINFIDLMQLEKNSVTNKNISYYREKTGVAVKFKLNDTTEKIIEKYRSEPESKFIFSILKTNNPSKTYLKNKSQKYLTVYVNKYLKNIMTKLEINKNITYYCARHSFATALKFENVSIEIIREALGHKDINSTMSYLNSLPDAKLDKIIEDVIK